ncbi:rho GTPase-activating protein 20-like [Nycticebus coucang]|uniref:rho GTPase-activating protein 20-like n=1 Tax=Nycticebus coucang TaxID=9470 RepID=UPI00234D17C8|nr:rho GTPase-activating protein 20-like [Nycticebus coucang]
MNSKIRSLVPNLGGSQGRGGSPESPSLVHPCPQPSVPVGTYELLPRGGAILEMPRPVISEVSLVPRTLGGAGTEMPREGAIPEVTCVSQTLSGAFTELTPLGTILEVTCEPLPPGGATLEMPQLEIPEVTCAQQTLGGAGMEMTTVGAIPEVICVPQTLTGSDTELPLVEAIPEVSCAPLPSGVATLEMPHLEIPEVTCAHQMLGGARTEMTTVGAILKVTCVPQTLSRTDTELPLVEAIPEVTCAPLPPFGATLEMPQLEVPEVSCAAVPPGVVTLKTPQLGFPEVICTQQSLGGASTELTSVGAISEITCAPLPPVGATLEMPQHEVLEVRCAPLLPSVATLETPQLGIPETLSRTDTDLPLVGAIPKLRCVPLPTGVDTLEMPQLKIPALTYGQLNLGGARTEMPQPEKNYKVTCGQPPLSEASSEMSRAAAHAIGEQQTLMKKTNTLLDRVLEEQPPTGRTLLIDGPVELKRGLKKQKRHIFLYNDVFVVAKTKCIKNFKTKSTIKLSDMWTTSCLAEEGEGNTEAVKSFILGWPTQNFVATFNSSQEKDKWLSLLQWNIDLEKVKDDPKNIPLKIYTQDVANCVHYKTIRVKNSHTAKEVVKMVFSILRVTGSDTDYQLWVNSGKKKERYPLVGHEYPYGILMSHLRDSEFMRRGPKFTTSTLTFQELSLMEELPPEIQCHFSLKPKCWAAAQQHRDLDHMISTRTCIINWACCCHSGTKLENSPVSPPSSSPALGKFFGVALPNICDYGDIPLPLYDVLFFLNAKGPLTAGIFWVPGDSDSCKDIIEKLDAGVEIDLGCENPYVLACVLKDFLKNIPESIFAKRLYHEWLSVMEISSDRQKIEKIKRLLDQLPRANVVLLRYVFLVLSNIAELSAANEMDALHLGVCMAPSIICHPSASREEMASAEKLVEFVIKNCRKIFGGHVTALFGESSRI